MHEHMDILRSSMDGCRLLVWLVPQLLLLVLRLPFQRPWLLLGKHRRGDMGIRIRRCMDDGNQRMSCKNSMDQLRLQARLRLQRIERKLRAKIFGIYHS